MVNQKPSVLIVDNDQVVCDVLDAELSDRGYLCTTALSGKEALAKLEAEDFAVVLLDIRLPGMSGMEVLREIWLNHGKTATIMITAVNDVDTAVEAMKLGASDYIVKPFVLDRVDASIRTALETKPATGKVPSGLDAIARGIERKVESITHYSWIVTERTMAVARELGIAEEEIQRWAAARAKLDSERERAMKSLLDRLRRNPLAQSMMGVAVPYRHTPKSDKS